MGEVWALSKMADARGGRSFEISTAHHDSPTFPEPR